MSNRLPALALAAALTAGLLISSATAANTRVSALDRHYLKSSAEGDAFEIAGGKLALEKSSDREVRTLASTLVKDHTKSLRETKAIARSLGVKVDAKPSPPQQWELSIVASKSGAAFNRWYAKLEVQDHEQDITDAQEERHSGTNSRVRVSAKQEIPDLRKHLALARRALH
jgi:putative membrane protein